MAIFKIIEHVVTMDNIAMWLCACIKINVILENHSKLQVKIILTDNGGYSYIHTFHDQLSNCGVTSRDRPIMPA